MPMSAVLDSGRTSGRSSSTFPVIEEIQDTPRSWEGEHHPGENNVNKVDGSVIELVEYH